ncbi:MAG: carbon-nitrogen hydrolase family protein [Gammaproteobacteria bacterium]
MTPCPIRSCLRIAAAQSASVPLDIDANLQRHLDFIDAAASAHVSLLVFPELSLCGYELADMARVALAPDDARLQVLLARAAATGMTIIAGAPVTTRDGRPAIAALGFHPDGRTTVYRKRFLHAGEEQFAQAGTALTQLHQVHGVPTALAICADTTHSQHAHAAAVSGAQLYVAGSLITPGGYAKDSAQLAGYAELYDMDVLMANHAARSGPFESAGRSAIWAAGGQLAAAAPGPGECLVIASFNEARVAPLPARAP